MRYSDNPNWQRRHPHGRRRHLHWELSFLFPSHTNLPTHINLPHTNTHTHTGTLSLTPTPTPAHTHTDNLSFSHTHTHTLTYTHIHREKKTNSKEWPGTLILKALAKTRIAPRHIKLKQREKPPLEPLLYKSQLCPESATTFSIQ